MPGAVGQLAAQLEAAVVAGLPPPSRIAALTGLTRVLSATWVAQSPTTNNAAFEGAVEGVTAAGLGRLESAVRGAAAGASDASGVVVQELECLTCVVRFLEAGGGGGRAGSGGGGGAFNQRRAAARSAAAGTGAAAAAGAAAAVAASPVAAGLLRRAWPLLEAASVAPALRRDVGVSKSLYKLFATIFGASRHDDHSAHTARPAPLAPSLAAPSAVRASLTRLLLTAPCLPPRAASQAHALPAPFRANPNSNPRRHMLSP